MELIWWIQTFFPPVLVAGICPLIITGCLLLAFGEWLYPQWRSAGIIYLLSVFSVPWISQVSRLDLRESAIVGGILVPAACGFLLVMNGSMRTLNAPRRSPSPSQPSKLLHFYHLHSQHSLFARMMKPAQALVGGCVGGILGMVFGLLFSLLVLALLSLLALLPIHYSTGNINDHFITAVLDAGIYTFGSLGLVLGVTIGLRLLNLQRLHQRVMISAVICSALMMRTVRNIFQIPYLSRRGMFQVAERHHTLMLRCRTYRSSDWVWMGFNSLYDAFALLVLGIALLRGTWTTLGLGVGVIVVIGILWTWYSLTRLLNYTTIALSLTTLSRWDAPLFSPKFPIQLPLQQIATITANVAVQPKFKTPFGSPEYQVCVVMMNGKRIPLLRHLEQWEEAIFVEETIEKFLSNYIR